MEYQIPGGKIRHINFDLCLFLAYETKTSLLEGFGTQPQLDSMTGKHTAHYHSDYSNTGKASLEEVQGSH